MTSKDQIDVLRSFCESYGIAVRAGLITPCLQDENEVRKLFKLPPAPDVVEAQWIKTNGVRMPITLKQDLEEADPIIVNETEEPQDV